jgi:anti-anti-sigma factor
MYDAKEMLDAVNEQIRAGRCWILINLEDVPYMSSEGLNILLKILTASRNHGGDTVLFSLNKQLEDLFLITRLAHIFPIFKDEDSARSKIESDYPVSNSDKPTQTV